MSVLDGILTDFQTEGDLLRAALTHLPEKAWRLPTPAQGWNVAAQIAHLAWTDQAAIAAATDKAAWNALAQSAVDDPAGFVDAAAFEIARTEPTALLARWDDGRAHLAEVLAAHDGKLPWFGPPMSAASMATARFMETWAHGLDVYDALGTTPEPTDRIRHIAHLGVRTRDFAFALRDEAPPAEAFLVDLKAPSGDRWAWGPENAAQRVSGSAYDFCLLVTQRIHRADTDLAAFGDDANRWLEIAQAFAGPPGQGRAPRR